jgi:hypothetical protein
MINLLSIASVSIPVFMLGTLAESFKEQANGTCVLIKNNVELNFLIVSIAAPIIVQKSLHLITGKCFDNWVIFPIGAIFLILSCLDSFKNNSSFESISKSVMVKLSIFLLCPLIYNGIQSIASSQC